MTTPNTPDEKPEPRKIAICHVWKAIPTFMRSGKKPWHALFFECHLMSVERTIFRNDLLSDRYNWAVGVETTYKRMRFVIEFGLN
jgi:hypothetical protein